MKHRVLIFILAIAAALAVTSCGGSTRSKAAFLSVPPVSIIGTPQVGQTITGTPSYAEGHWAWLDCASASSSCSQISGTQGQVKLALTSSLANQWIRYVIEGGTKPPANAASGASVAVQVEPPSVTSTTSTTTTTVTTTITRPAPITPPHIQTRRTH